MHERYRDAVLGAWGRQAAAHPRLALTICLLLAATAAVLTVQQLEFHADRSDLVDPDLGWNRRYAQHKARFDRWDDLIVCLDGPVGDVRIDEFARTTAQRLSVDARVVAADAGFRIAETGPRLFAAAPDDVFTRTLDQIARARRTVAAPNANAWLGAALGTLAAEDGPDDGTDDLDRLEQVLAPYLAALDDASTDSTGATAFAFLRPDEPRWQPLVSDQGSGRLRFIQVALAPHEGGIDELSADIRWLREEIADAVAGSGLTDLEWGVTGIPAIEADETAQSIRDSTIASIVAFVLITTLMVIVFRGVTVPLLAAGSLLLGMTWSFGWLVLSVGHLQLLSVVFSVILLGLGIDFALHLVARLELVHDQHDDLPSAMARVFRGVGPGMLTGAITTAAAFGATAVTQFKGMAEMGIIAGGGILLCLIAVLTSFPAALALTGRWKRVIRRRGGGETAHFAHGALDVIDFHPRPAMIVALLVAAIVFLPARRVRYDPNVLNLHPPGIESVEWARRIVEDDSGSVWSALVETTPEAAGELADRFRVLPEVAGVGGMALLRPADRDERAARIARIREASVAVAEASPDLATLRQQLAAVRLGLVRSADAEPRATATRMRALAHGIARALTASATLTVDEQAARFAALDAAFDTARASLGAWVDEALAPQQLDASDLPPMLREQWTRDGVWLMQIAPATRPGCASILDPECLSAFVAALRSVTPEVLGPPIQIHESSKLVQREYIKAAVFAVIAILVLLLLDFRSLADTLCAMVPVTIGFLDAFGLMGLFGVPLNFANIIVMPLIFGIGVDAGVHVVHRWRAEPYGRPAGLSGGTGRGITLTMTSTMIGFGCMLLAEHRGIRSLGFVMLAGLGVTLLACYTVLPALLRLRTVHWREAD